MKTLGPLLIRTGLLSQEQFAKAMDLQVRTNLPIHEILINQGLLKENDLVEVFKKDMMIPELRREDLHDIEPDIKNLIPREMAFRYCVLPVRFDLHGHLIVAMANPADNHAADELMRSTQLYIVRCVAPTSLIKDCIAKTYGGLKKEEPNIPPPAAPPPSAPAAPAPPPSAPAFQKSDSAKARDEDTVSDFGTKKDIKDNTGSELETEEVVLLTKIIRPSAKIRPQMDVPLTVDGVDGVDGESSYKLEDMNDEEGEIINLTKVKQKTPLESTNESPTSGSPQVSKVSEFASTSAQSKVGTLAGLPFPGKTKLKSGSEGEEPKGWTAPRKEKVKEAKFSKTPTLLGIPAISVQPGPATERQNTKEGWSAPKAQRETKANTGDSAGFESAIRILKKTNNRDEVGGILCDYLSSFCRGTAFFVLKDGFLQIREVRGARGDKNRIQELRISLSLPSRMKETVDSRLPYRGSPGSEKTDILFHKTFGYMPQKVVMFPVTIRERVIALLYGDQMGPRFKSKAVSELLIHAERAYERLLLSKKKT